MTELTDTERADLDCAIYDGAEAVDPDERADVMNAVTVTVEQIVHDRLAAARAEGARDMRTKIETLHKPYSICDDCDHQHTDEDVQEGRAFDTGYSYTCEAALMYVACSACCTHNDEQTEDCAYYHNHSKNPDDRCPTVALLADGGEPK